MSGNSNIAITQSVSESVSQSVDQIIAKSHPFDTVDYDILFQSDNLLSLLGSVFR